MKDHPIPSDECCDICGDKGVSDAIVTCTRCKVNCEHLYCMCVIREDYPEDWCCDDCESRTKKASTASGTREDLEKESSSRTSKKLKFDSSQPCKPPYEPRRNLMDHGKKILSGKTKLLSFEEVIMLPSRNETCVSPVKASFHSKSVWRKNSGTLHLKTPVKSRAIPEKSSSQLIRAGPALVPAPSPSPSKRFKPLRPTNSHMHAVAQHQAPQSFKGLREKNVNEVSLKHHLQKVEHLLQDPLEEKSQSAIGNTAGVRLEKAIGETRSASSPTMHRQQIVCSGGAAFHDLDSQKTRLMTPVASTRVHASVNCFADPSSDASWIGSFKVFNAPTRGEISDEVQAYPPSRVLRKVYEFSKLMPEVLQFELVPRGDLWAALFQQFCLDKRDIGLYFFPRNRRRPVTGQHADTKEQKNYGLLLELMGAEELAMRAQVNGLELLIFSSKVLSTDCQRWKGRYFLWGVLKKKSYHLSPFVGHGCNTGLDSDEVEMEIDMIGGEDVGRTDIVVLRDSVRLPLSDDTADMEIDMIAGKDVGRMDIALPKASLQLPPTNVTMETHIPPGFEGLCSLNRVRAIKNEKSCSSTDNVGHGAAIKTETPHGEERHRIANGQTMTSSTPNGECFSKPVPPVNVKTEL